MKFAPILTVAAMVASFGTAAGAQAHGWAYHHPWRAYDNGRLANQNYRIRQGVRDGQLSHAQARQLHADDHSIRMEERADAAVNGSHLTRQNQRQIQQQENANSRAIYGERHN